jgi:hypothetical protein
VRKNSGETEIKRERRAHKVMEKMEWEGDVRNKRTKRRTARKREREGERPWKGNNGGESVRRGNGESHSFGKKDRERNRERSATRMAGAEMAEVIGRERKRARDGFKRGRE